MVLLGQPVDREASDPRPSFTDSWYDLANNVAQVGPAAILSFPGLRDEDRDDAMLYGASWLAHEISHALDAEGRHRDAYGNEVNWWTPADEAAFLARGRLLVAQYDEYMPLDGIRVNGQRTPSENMADVVGLRIAAPAPVRSRHRLGRHPATGPGGALRRAAPTAHCFGFFSL